MRMEKHLWNDRIVDVMALPTIQLTDEQVIALIKQLPPERKRTALFILAEEARGQREARLDDAEAQLRQLYAEHGQDWDAMSEEAREAFIDDLMPEGLEAVSVSKPTVAWYERYFKYL